MVKEVILFWLNNRGHSKGLEVHLLPMYTVHCTLVWEQDNAELLQKWWHALINVTFMCMSRCYHISYYCVVTSYFWFLVTSWHINTPSGTFASSVRAELVVLSESDGWHELWSGATHRNWVSFEMCLLSFSCPEQSEATALCLWAHLTQSLEQSCKPQICEKESNQERKWGLCIWRPVRKNQFAWKWRHHFPQGWFVLLNLLTGSCRNVPWNRGFSQVEGEKTLTLGWAQVAGERLPLNANSPPCGREALVDRLPLFIVVASSGLAEDHELLSVWCLSILSKEGKKHRQEW